MMQIKYSELKENYLDIISLVEQESGFHEIKYANSKIESDIGMSGDDNWELLIDFAEKYNIDFTNFDYSKHFESEGEITSGIRYLITLLLLPLFILNYIIHVFFNKKLIDFQKFNHLFKTRPLHGTLFSCHLEEKLKI